MTKQCKTPDYSLSPDELPLMERLLEGVCENRTEEYAAAFRLAGRMLIETDEAGVIVLTRAGRAALDHHRTKLRSRMALERPRRAALAGAVALRARQTARQELPAPERRFDEIPLSELLSIRTYDRRVTARRIKLPSTDAAYMVSPEASQFWRAQP